jgi:hypothetical protein
LVLLALLVVFVALSVVASGSLQIAAWIGAALVLATMAGGGFARGSAASPRVTASLRGRTITYAEPEVLDEATTDEASWQRERERRERDAQS